MKEKTIQKVLIGLEIHGYLETEEKLFCRCKNFHDMKLIEPNTYICPICTGQPGAKPMLPNTSAIDTLIKIGLFLGCTIHTYEARKPLLFQRKHYDWPDMPYGYQKTISGAHSHHVAVDGLFEGKRIREVHLEEDPAAWNPDNGQIDYNRAGVPLVEIVTEPDFSSAEEVLGWLQKLILTLSYIKALNKDAGIKADVNVNIAGLTERTEIKNVNSAREIVRAIESEIARHMQEKPLFRETRRWNSTRGKTELMRSKEEAADYRFIPDPDLPIIELTQSRVASIQKLLPQTPGEKLHKLIHKHALSKEHATVLTRNFDIIKLFESVIEKIPAPFAAPWITVEWMSVLNHHRKTMDDVIINPDHIIELLELLQKKLITPLKAKEIMRRFVPHSFSPKHEIHQSGTIKDTKEIKKIIQEVIKKNNKSVVDYKSGEEKAFHFLMGQVMQATGKRADYRVVKELLEKELKH